MKISELRRKDITEIAVLLRNYWEERGMRYSQAWTKNYIKNGHSSEIKKEKFFVLKEKSNIIGYISIIIWEGNLAELRDFVIKKKFRHIGNGKKLLEYSLNWCRRNKIRKIMSLTFPKYKKFLEKFGFKKEGFLQNHFKNRENLYFMSKQVK